MNGLKQALSRENLAANLKFFVKLNAGLILTAIGIVLFKTPNHFAFGGTSGLSILLASLFPQFNVGGFMWVINVLLVVLGYIFLGIGCMGWTVYSSFALSFFVSVCEVIWPLTAPLTSDTLLELVFAVLLPAVGSAIVFDIGASTGGTDIVALILAKHTSLEIGKALMVSDILIVAGAGVKFGIAKMLHIKVSQVFYSLLAVQKGVQEANQEILVHVRPENLLESEVGIRIDVTVANTFGSHSKRFRQKYHKNLCQKAF